MTGWIGVDFDGTLAEYSGWQGEDHLGAPIPAMVDRVKAWLAAHRDVRLFTARAAYGPAQIALLEWWCMVHLGAVLPITNVKDLAMVALYDDRAVAVELNTGRIIGGQEFLP